MRETGAKQRNYVKGTGRKCFPSDHARWSKRWPFRNRGCRGETQVLVESLTEKKRLLEMSVES